MSLACLQLLPLQIDRPSFNFRLILPKHLWESMNTFHSCLSLPFQSHSLSPIKWGQWSVSAKKGWVGTFWFTTPVVTFYLLRPRWCAVFSAWSRGASAISWSQWTAFHHKYFQNNGFFALWRWALGCKAVLVGMRHWANELFSPAYHRKHSQQVSWNKRAFLLKCDDWKMVWS